MVFFVLLIALPPFRVFFEAMYGYDVNCFVCHNQDDWEVNSYGKDFLKYGGDFSSLKKIEELDSDRDSYKNIDEIKSKSNPADTSSTPEKPGVWLKEVIPIKPPAKILNRFFKDAVFKVIKSPMDENGVMAFKKLTGRQPDEYEKLNVVFGIEKDGSIIGFASYITFFKNNKFNAVLGIFDREGGVLYIHPVHIHDKNLKETIKKDYKNIKELTEKLKGIVASCRIKTGLN